MKFLHAADLHLGSPLRAASARDAGQGALLAREAGGVLERIVDVALRERVDAVLLAGDVFDDSAADVTLRARLAVQLSRLTRARIPVAMIRGNHDALAEVERYGPLGDGIHLLDEANPSVRIGGATVHGLGFRARHAEHSMLPDYPAPERGQLNVGLMHTSLDGAAGHDPYAPTRAGDLLAHGYDYWALGHIHKRSETVSAGVAVVMPGIPQGRHVGEGGIGSVTIATLGGMPELRQVPVARVAFERVSLDVGGLDMAGMVDAVLRVAPERDGTHRLLRIEVAGSGLPAAEMAALAVEALADRDDVSVEGVRVRVAEAGAEAGPLAAAMAAQAASDSFRDEAAGILTELRGALPREVADALAPDLLDELIAEGIAEAARMLATGGRDPEGPARVGPAGGADG